MKANLANVIKKLPKTDLHVHLDGSLRIPTLIELAKKYKITLPSYTEEGLRKQVFKDKYESLGEYLKGFAFTCAVMQTEEALERIAYELAMDNFAEGVRYIEPRFAPQLHVSPNLSIEQILSSVNKGLERAAKEINSKKEIKEGKEPPFAYGIIGSALRMFRKNFSYYYKNFLEAHEYSPKEEAYSLAAMELVRAMVKTRDELGIPIVGFDLAGEEVGYPAEDYKKAAQFAHKNFMQKTIHAGEAYGPPSIFQAVTDLYADRLGHGTYIFDSSMVGLPTKVENEKYTRSLAKFVNDRRITIEVCLTSNMQTTPRFRDLKDHPFKKMMEERLSVTLCTDNRLVSNTTVTDEILKAVETFSIPVPKLKDMIIYGFKRSFYPGSYLEKRKYVRQIIDYCDKLISSGDTHLRAPL
ncbi:MAG: adenosine deaminase [Deltaproteobacteria bacterium CG11_big_fil_rev_8_21_14_0_20_49_13]|nr:MAG: adenosine deaminase [Deltaproteobacteria bacterium CG11_big_fil_rev_8_21_14_0_20_49_13]